MVEYVDHLFSLALSINASDIHIEPQAEGLRIRQRIDGFLVQTDFLEHRYIAPILSRLKVMAGLDIAERRLPQDGSISLQVQDSLRDVRLSTMPTVYGEKLVLRLLHNSAHSLQLAQLGIEPQELSRVEALLKRTSGLVVITGPTGAGKTTTLYSLLQHLNLPEKNLLTLEDPVELKLAGVNQVQVRPNAGLTFARGLRSILRQDPDVIMIGEIRDKETAEIAVTAALTGHLVLSTLHTADCASAITRLLDMQVEPYRVRAAVAGVIAQRLYRVPCFICKGEMCNLCHQTGYRGRSGLFEVITCDEDFERLQHLSSVDLRCFFRSRGMRSLQDIAAAKISANKTTLEEILWVINDVEQAELLACR